MIWALLVLMGGHAISSQVLLIRELLVVLSGHELCLGILFASWLGGIFFGAWLGGKVQERTRYLLKIFLWVQMGAIFLAPAVVIAIRCAKALIPTAPGVPIPLVPTFLTSGVTVTPLSVLVGFLFPMACRVVAHHSHGPAQTIGKVYVLEAVGSLLAGGLLTYLLLPRMNSITILALWGLAISLVATGVALGRGRAGAIPFGAFSAFWALSLVFGGVNAIQRVSIKARWEAFHPGVQRLATRDSRYQSVEMGRLDGQYSVFGNGHLLTTFPDPYGAAFTVHLLMNQRPQPKRLLVLGGGPGSLLPMILTYPVDRIQSVELDPLVFQLAKPYLTSQERKAMEDSRVHLTFTDGRHWVRTCPPQSFDAVLLRVPDPATALLNRYHTEEFFQDLRRILSPAGLVVTSVTGSVNYIGMEIQGYVGNIYRTLREVFPKVLLVPGDRALLIATTAMGAATLDPYILSARYRTGVLPNEVFPAEAFFSWIQEDRIQLWMRALAGYEGPLNRDARPVAFVHYLTLLDLISGRKFVQSPLRHLTAIRFNWVLAFWIIGLMAVLLTLRGHTVRRTPLIVMGITGLSAMAQEILCLYMYQAIQGYLYSRLGVIVALFMAGLAFGGWLGARGCPSSPRRTLLYLLWVQVFMLILCMGIPLGWVPAFFGSGGVRLAGGFVDAAVGLWMVMAGAGTGLTFPLACGLMSQMGPTIGVIAGKVDASDHLGAALGALLAGTFLVPIFGLSQTGSFLAVLQGSALLLVGLSLLELRR